MDRQNRLLYPRSGSLNLWAFVLCAVVACLLSEPVPAFPESSATTAEHRAILELYVNEVRKGEVMVIFRGQEVLVHVDDLKGTGLDLLAGAATAIGGKQFVSLSSLTPAVAYRFDEAKLALRVSIDPSLLGTTTVRLRKTQPADLTYMSSPSVFVNYALTAVDFKSPSLFTEGGGSIDGKLLYSSLSLNPGGALVRGLTNLTMDNPGLLTRTTVGDTFANTGLLGGGVFLGGISFSRNFALNPYLVTFPSQQLSGQVSTPSTADVYVNGVLAKSVNLPPGRFNLQDLPAPAGAGNSQVIVRNAFGEQQVINAPYYLSTQLLKEGLSQYTYNLGLVRNNQGTASWDYGPPAFAASHLYGLTDRLTLGGFFQTDGRVASGGTQTAISTMFGQFGLWGAFSGGNGAGPSAAATYSYLTRRWSFGGDVTLTGRSYSTLALSRAQDRPLTQADVFLGFQVGRFSISNIFRYLDYRDSGRAYSVSITNAMRLSNSVSLSLTATRSFSQSTGQATDVILALTFLLGKRTMSTTSYDHRSGQSNQGSYGTVQVQKSLPLGSGYGYLLQGQTGQEAQQVANLQYRGPHGLYELDNTRFQGQETSTLRVSGGLVGIDGRVFATPPVQDSYALIHVPDLKGVTGYYSNQSIGRTDSNGNLLVPTLLSYYGNDLSINDGDIPIDYSVEKTQRIVATPYRGGAVVTFPVRRLQAFTGTVEVYHAGKTVIPAYGQLSLTVKGKETAGAGEFISPIGRHGEFYLENVPAGNWPAVIGYRDGECRLSFTVPSSKELFVKMGTVRCEIP